MSAPNLFDDIMAIARAGFERGKAGVTSGLNNRGYGGNGGLGRLFGTGHLSAMGGRMAATGNRYRGKMRGGDRYVRAQGPATKSGGVPIVPARGNSSSRGSYGNRPIRGFGGDVMDYFTAKDMAAVGTMPARGSRGVAIAARAGGAAGAMGAADFFNPFGFGWND